jgi:predicted nucleic-acid-binding protein
MIALDTNVVVRLLVAANDEQHDIARSVVARGAVYASLAVLMETEWVLRKSYGFSRSDIAAALRAFAGLKTVTVENETSLQSVLTLFEAGFDFADAVHIVEASRAERFATFDRDLDRLGKKVPTPIQIFVPILELGT